MAGEWIKMRTNLWDDPRVSRLCDLVEQPEAMVVGALYWLWSMADEHSEDGLLPGLTLRAIDRKTGVLGIGQSLVQIGWLLESEAGIEVVKFDEHNGVSAKRRCMEAQRKAKSRNVSAPDADNSPPPCGAREEKNINTPPHHAGEPQSTGDGQPAPGAPFEMTLDWEPDRKHLKALAFRAGLNMGLFTQEAVGGFVVHHQAKHIPRSSDEWHAALLNWVKRDAVTAANVTPLRPAKAPSDDDFEANGWLGGRQ